MLERCRTPKDPSNACAAVGHVDLPTGWAAAAARHWDDVGFLQRSDFHRTYALARFSPRPRKNRLVRKYYYQRSRGPVRPVQVGDNTQMKNTTPLSAKLIRIGAALLLTALLKRWHA